MKTKPVHIKKVVNPILLFAVIVFCGIYAWIQISYYEDGISDIYAEQQDGYIKLVIDQITLLNGKESNETTIKNILGTLDTSDKQYWTLTQDGTIVFVKNVMETNQYRNFNSSTYFDKINMNEFIKGLSKDMVSHQTLSIKGKEYIISGSVFEFKGKNYKVCLLTSKDIIFENNTYLNAKINIGIMLCTIISIFIVYMIVENMKLSKKDKILKNNEKEIKSLLSLKEKASNEISERNIFDSQTMTFNKQMIRPFIDGLDTNNEKLLTISIVEYETEIERKMILVDSQLFFSKNVFKFDVGENRMLLLFVHVKKENAEDIMRMVFQNGPKVKETKEIYLMENEKMKDKFFNIIKDNEFFDVIKNI